MNYVEIVERQEELQTEMNELQGARIESAQSHTSLATDTMAGNVNCVLSLDYDSMDPMILKLATDNGVVSLSVEDFNAVGAFLQKYNDAIFSYMSELNKPDEDETKEEA